MSTVNEVMAVLAIVHGRVQGVGYRYWAVREASGLGIDGWVCNRRDGSVEMLLDGPAATVETMLERCRAGPAAARVDRMEVRETAERAPAGFVQLSTV